MATEIHILPKPKFMGTDESFRWLELNDKLAAFLKASGLHYMAYPNGNTGWLASMNSPSIYDVVTDFAAAHGYEVHWVSGTITKSSIARLIPLKKKKRTHQGAHQ